MNPDPLYRRVLEAEFDGLCPSVRALHSVTGSFRAAGGCDVTRGANWLANRLADLVGMPPAGKDVPLTFSIDVVGDSARWTRDFAGHRFQSLLWAEGSRVFERLNPVVLEFRLELERGSLSMVLQRGWLLGLLPLPRFCLPQVSTRESCGADGRYRFVVQVDWPLLGPVVRYQGWLDVR